MARLETLQAKGAGEGARRGPHDRLGAERQAARELRSQRPEEDRDGGGPAPTRKAIPASVTPTSYDPSVAFFNCLDHSPKSACDFVEIVWPRSRIPSESDLRLGASPPHVAEADKYAPSRKADL
jgi:hypothetical protein